MTSNSQQKDLRDELLPEQNVTGWPELCFSDFRIKQRTMVRYSITGEVFREGKAHVCVIDLQECSLFHAHCMSFLSESLKAPLPQSNNVESIISADIPSRIHQVPLHLI